MTEDTSAPMCHDWNEQGQGQRLGMEGGRQAERMQDDRTGLCARAHEGPVTVRGRRTGSGPTRRQRAEPQHTIPPEVISNDFWGFLELISRFKFEFRRRGKIFLKDSNFWCVQSSITHTMWLLMCMCCGLFAPTQFHFECCCVWDDS